MPADRLIRCPAAAAAQASRRRSTVEAPGAKRAGAVAGALIFWLVWLLLPDMAKAASCTVSVATMNFGSYTGAAATPGPTPVTLNCTSGAAFNIGVNNGNNGGSMFYNWSMAGPNSHLLSYKLYQDSSRSSYLGGSRGYDTINGTGTGSNQTVYIYSAAPAQPSVVPGSYSDSVTITVYVSGGSTVTTTMPVMATVSAACSISAGNLAFGVYTGTSATTGTAALTATCTNTTTYQIGADLGQHSQYGGLFMIGASGAQNINNVLQYHIYTDAGRTQAWGNTPGSNEIAGTGSGSAQMITIYGQINTGHYEVNPGSYSDVVTVTINF